MTAEQMIGLLDRLVKLFGAIVGMCIKGVRDINKIIAVLQAINDGDCKPDVVLDWTRVYAELGMSAEYAEFVKAHSVGEDPSLWIVPVFKGVTCNKVISTLRELGVNVYTYVDDLDASVPKNDRDPRSGSYVVGFGKNVEADEENRSKSANTLAKAGHKGITLLERLLLELGYFLATGEHLDAKNVTLCTGSRDSDGDVPDVDWSPDDHEVCVSWYSPDRYGGSVRSRSVRFLAPKPANAG